jgi:hypothetical protein
VECCCWALVQTKWHVLLNGYQMLAENACKNFLTHISLLFALADAQWERAGSKAITLLILGRFQETFLADAKPNSVITT